MAFTSRFQPRARTGPQRPKVNSDENAIINKHVKQPSVVGPSRVFSKFGPQRPALGEVTSNAVNKQSAKIPGKGIIKEDVNLKRSRSSSLAAATGPQRVPLGPIRPAFNSTSTSTVSVPAPAPLRAQRPPITIRQSETAPELHRRTPVVVHDEVEVLDDENMEIEEQEVVHEVMQSKVGVSHEPDLDLEDELEEDEDRPRAAEKYSREIERIQTTFHDEVDMFDTTMVSEYADEIFGYMSNLEVDMMPNPDYILGQSEITWDMRQTLVDWLLQVHLRYRLLPETLWITINIIDRFLSKRIVSIIKLQLVGVTAMFIAAKYEEILAPSVEEFVFMTENGYTKEEILKGERIVLQTLDFKVSSYCSPYSWVRRISKADDYDIQTRTLCKYLVEVTLLDYQFLRVKPSLVAAVGMYTARRMLGGNWNEAFVFYSGYTEEHLIPGHNFVISKLLDAGFDRQYVSRKYANKKFLKASVYAIDWAHMNGTIPVDEELDGMVLEA
ncbi:cyclin [Phellopilus nigrolimitatus]|nr:cyclin [Phellopilus nigrolimitatus]